MTILLVEDERDIAKPLLDLLRAQRYQVRWSRRLDEALELLPEEHFDLAVLDIMLPEGKDAGFQLAETMRSAGFEGCILFLTARSSIEDRVRGFELGGDDYLIKPFSLREFLVRVQALLRRGAQTRCPVFERGALQVDLNKRRVLWEGRGVRLSGREFAILESLILYPDRVFTVEELFSRFFPNAKSGHRIVRVYVRQLRKKLAPRLIETVPGGYTLGV